MSSFPMRFLVSTLVLVIGAISLSACAGADEPGLPAASAEAVIAYLQEVDYEGSWELWPGLDKMYQGDEPHGFLLTTYLNPAAFEALQDKAGVMPAGAIVVKENYTGDKVLDATTVMYKKAGYNPGHNDWFWLKYAADGTVQKEGMVEGCQMCHGEVSDNDYVWTGPLK